jgi:tetratricopeptide (TPR) repeat protein
MEDRTETVPLPGGALPRDARDVDDAGGAGAALGRGALVGRYVILERIGAGGMGVVYAAYDPELDRKVAVKLLRRDRLPRDADRRLREAQALARLTHPNVVAVHDAGTFGDRVFLAMELVEGETLRRWLAAAPRSWREVLDRFLPAGRGLAAAHAAGLVHRDFKPENVLLGRDGRVRVVDFGLAKALGEGTPEGLEAPPGLARGTPSYMAPEILRGLAADARSDQFSFSVALWEALHGERPFAGAGGRGELREAPAGSRVPAWLRGVVARGLQADPAARHATMDDLLRKLESDPAARRRRWLAAAATVLVLGASFSGLGYFQARRAQLCGGGKEELAGIWDAGRKRMLRSAFLATGAPFAAAAARSVARQLDDYTRDWVASRRSACEATRLRGQQSEDLLDRKTSCLDQRLREVRALTELLIRPDARLVERSLDTVRALPDLAVCSRAGALLEREAPPRDPALRAAIEGGQTALAGAQALQRAGRYREALVRAERVEEAVRGLPSHLLQAETLLLLGKLHLALGDFPRSEAELYEAAWAAEEGRDDRLKTEAWRELVSNVGVRQGRYGEARRLERQAEAALARTGGDPATEMSLLNTEATLLSAQDDYRQATRKLERAQALADRIDARHPRYGILTNLAANYRDMGSPEAALPVLRRALEIAEQAVGPVHPHVAGLLFNLGLCFSDLGRYDEAAGLLRQALAAQERLLGGDHPSVGDTLVGIGSNWTRRGRPELALPLLRRALAIFAAKAPGTPNEWAIAEAELGNAERGLGHYAEAVEEERAAIRCIETKAGPASDSLLTPLPVLGAVYLEEKRPDLAIPPLERAVKSYDSPRPAYPRWSAEARFLLARALWDARRDRTRAVLLARQAREIYGKIPPSARTELSRLDLWLAGHGG